MNLLPLLGALVFAAVVMGWRPWLQYRRHGTWGITILRSSPLQNLRDTLGIVLFALLVGQAIVAVGWPASRSLGQAVIGAALLFGGIALLITAQLHLGASWRIGIDERATPGLVTTRLYRFSRNPIYLALFTTVAGYTVLLPTRMSIALLIGTCVGVRQQVAAEEAHLLRAYGDAYRDYARRVGRFVPGLGRLR